jgi:hypothetical protein
MTTTNSSTVSSTSDLQAELSRLREENEKLKAKADRKVSFKVGEKGGVSMYGINARFPITLYANQWEKVIAHVSELSAFIETNRKFLAVKE